MASHSSEQQQSIEEGWPSRDFGKSARSFLLTEARQRVQEQLTHIAAQDVKVVALFTASVLVFTASGILGDVRLALDPVVVLTLVTYTASVVAWMVLGVAYWTRDVKVGIDIDILRKEYVGTPADELRDASLEALAYAFSVNQRVISDKAKWLRRAFVAVALQFMFLIAFVIASTASDSQEAAMPEPPPANGSESSTTRFSSDW